MLGHQLRNQWTNNGVDERCPRVDSHSAVLKVGNGVINRFRVFLLRVGVDEDRAAERSPELLVAKGDRRFEKLGGVAVEVDNTQNAAECLQT